MRVDRPVRETTLRRKARWVFEELSTLRHAIIQRAGRITHPKGKFTLTLATNHHLQHSILRFMAS